MRLSYLIILIITIIVQNPLMSQTILYQDDFEDSTASLWWTEDKNFKIIKVANNHVLKGTDEAFSYIGDPWSWKDYTFSVLVNLVEGNDSEIRFRHNGKYGEYKIYILKNSIWLSRSNVNEGSITDIMPATVELNNNTWHLFKVKVFQNDIEIYVDNQLLIRYRDDKPREYGQVGIAVNTGVAYFDNLCVETDQNIPRQNRSWAKLNGPVGGMGYDVRIHPINHDIMFVTDVWSGIHKSINGGKTWQPKNTGINIRQTPRHENRLGPTGDAIPIFCVTIDPSNPDIVWCGTQYYKGIYKSTDCGESWIEKINGIPDIPVTFRSFAVDPTNSDIVYCACEITVKDGSQQDTGKIFKTIDGGEHWFEVLDSKALVRIILIDPRNTCVLYASTGIFDRGSAQEEGVWKSVDGGETWFHANEGLYQGALTIEGLDFNRLNPDILYASTGRGFGGLPGRQETNIYGGIYRSDDGATTWRRLLRGEPGVQYEGMFLAVSPSNPDIVYVTNSLDAKGISYAMQRTFDGGETWAEFSLNYDNIQAGEPICVTVHPTKPNVVFINFYGGGVSRSEDYGETYVSWSKGYTGAQMYDIAIYPYNPSYILATNNVSAFKSINGGEDWHGINTIQYRLSNCAIEMSPNNHNEILAGNLYCLFKSNDGGMSWHNVIQKSWITPYDVGTYSDISWSRTNPEIVYASFKFVRNNESPTDSLAYGIFKSEDRGETWRSINNGFENTKMSALTVQVHPTNPDIVFTCIKNGGIYKSVNGGDSWTLQCPELSKFQVQCFAFDPVNPDIIYAGMEIGGIYKSTDSGGSWKQIVRGMDPEATVRSIVVNPQDHLEVFAFDWFAGVYRSIDAGDSWYLYNDGLTTKNGQSLAISNDGRILYAGTEGGGVFRMIRDNTRPNFVYIFPDTADQITVEYGDKCEFSILAHDLDSDTLSYLWRLDNTIVTSVSGIIYQLNSNGMTLGQHQLSVRITDGTLGTTAHWTICVVQSEPPEISLNSHLGGEIFLSGKLTDILWTAIDNVDVTSIDICYSTNDGQSWSDVVKNFENSGKYLWEIPYEPSKRCKLKIIAYDAVGNSAEDKSDSTFTISSLQVSHLKPSDYQLAYLKVGDECYIEGGYVITSIPPRFKNLLWIKTKNQDNLSTGDNFISFRVNEPVIVYVAYDPWLDAIPDWLKSWTTTGDSIGRSVHDPYPVYSKEFQTETICLGGNYFGGSMYFVLVQSNPVTGIDKQFLKNIPTEYSLSQNYPNPFNSATIIKFAVKKSCRVELTIYDLLGREVRKLVNQNYHAGYHQVIFDVQQLAAGLYFYEIKMSDFRNVKKAMVLK